MSEDFSNRCEPVGRSVAVEPFPIVLISPVLIFARREQQISKSVCIKRSLRERRLNYPRGRSDLPPVNPTIHN